MEAVKKKSHRRNGKKKVKQQQKIEEELGGTLVLNSAATEDIVDALQNEQSVLVATSGNTSGGSPRNAHVPTMAWDVNEDNMMNTIATQMEEMEETKINPTDEDVMKLDSEIHQNEEDLFALLDASLSELDSPYGVHEQSDDIQLEEKEYRSDAAVEFEVMQETLHSTNIEAEEPINTIAEPENKQAEVEYVKKEITAETSDVQNTVEALSLPARVPVAIFPVHIASAPSAPSFSGSDEECVVETFPDKFMKNSRSLFETPSAPQFHDDQEASEPVTRHTSGDMTPSAPPENEMVESESDVGDPRVLIPSAPSLSPIKIAKSPVSKRDIQSDKVMRIQGRSTLSQSMETVGAAVRNSFAKTRMSDSGRRSLYPLVPQQAASVQMTSTSISGHLMSGTHVEHEGHVNKQLRHHVRIKLEPYVNFEINLLRAEASQKRQEMKMHHIESNKGELYARLERYLFAEYLLHAAASTQASYKKEIDVLVKKVWILEQKRLSSSQRCGDHTEIEQELEFQTAKLEPQQLEKLKVHLDKLRQLRTIEASMHTFDRAMAYFHVEQYLNSILQEPNLVSFLNKMSASCVSNSGSLSASARAIGDIDLVPAGINYFETLPAGSVLSSLVDHLKYCVDVLIFFEKKVTLDEKGLFGRIPQSFYRGELVWHSSKSKIHHGSNGGMERKVKCYACGCLNSPMETNQWCKTCDSCGVVLYLPPSSVSTTSNEWYSSVVRFRQSLQKWISTCLQSLLRTKSLNNMPYLLMHTMYLPRIATEERSWLLRFLQFPRAMVATDGSLQHEWSEDLVDHYLAMLHLVFHPEKLRRMAVLVSSGPPPNVSAASSNGAGEDGGTIVSPEWVLLQNPDMLDRYYLSDEDFVAVLNQFPNSFAFEQLFRCSLDVKKSFSRALTVVLELTQSLRAFQEFEKFPARVAQLLGELLEGASQIPASTAAVSMTSDSNFYPTLFDQLFLTALHGLIVADCNRVAWRSLSSFPFGSLSELAKWDVLALLLFNIPKVPEEAKTMSGWVQFMETNGANRSILYDLISSDTENAVHLLNAVASLAASCATGTKIGRKGIHQIDERDDLVSVAVHELFTAGYTVPSCRNALGENGERAAVPISTICLVHPWIISLLITLLFKYHECAATWIHVFETFPINRWVPTASDLTNVQEWLMLKNTSAPRSALARFLLDRINWEFDIKEQRLFTSPHLHRQVALIVAEALVLYKTRREHPHELTSTITTSGSGAPQKLHVSSIAKSIRRALWLEDTVDFPQWCWKLMLRLKFYSPKTHEPFVELIDLHRDRSREALTLRRWFAGASAMSTYQIVPFYASLEQHVAELGSKCDDRSGNGGGTGAPIQEGVIQSQEYDNSNINSTVSATAALTTEPIVAYVICQMTTFVFSDRIDRWKPLLILLKNDLFSAAIKVLETIFPILSKFDSVKRGSVALPESSVNKDDHDNLNEAKSKIDGSDAHGPWSVDTIDHELDVCMAAMQTLSTENLVLLIRSLHENSYINTEEHQRMEEILHKGYIGGWESTAKARILTQLRFVRECSRYLHPVVLPALINEKFPQSSPVALTTAALFHGAMSWISTTLGGGSNSSPPSPCAVSSTCAALSIRKSSLTANATSTSAAATASLGMLTPTTDYTTSAKALASLIERAFEYSTDSAALCESMIFWMKALLQVPFWYESHAFRHLLDVLVHCSMGQHYALQLTGNDQPKQSILFEVVAILQSAFDAYCHQLKRKKDELAHSNHLFQEDESVVVVSFLPATNASATFSSIFSGAFDVAQYVENCSFLALWVLLVETRQELPLFLTMGQLMIKYEPKTMTKLEKMKKTKGKLATELSMLGLNTSPCGSSGSPVYTKCFLFGHTNFDSLSEYKFYRWCEYCLEMPEHDEAQILYWQVFFALYFACAGGNHVFGHYFLERDGSHKAKRVHLRKNLQTKLRTMVNYCSNQAQVVLTTTNGITGLSSELKEKKYAHFATLSQIYTAMDAWLEEQDPNRWLKEEELVALPRHFEVKRLREILHLSDVLLRPNADTEFDWSDFQLWLSLCGFEFTSRQHQVSNVKSADQIRTQTNGVKAVIPTVEGGHDEGFAFVEEAADLKRRHSSFSGLGGSNGRNIRPLPLLPELYGPMSLTQLPLVSVAITQDSCILTPSIQLNKHGLKNVAVKFSENLSVLVALDAELMDHVSQLYSSKTRTVTKSQSCTEGTNCRMPATCRFEFMEWTIDNRLSEAIQTILSHSERCDMKSMLLTNVTSTLTEHHQPIDDDTLQLVGVASNHSAVDEFLKLDADGMMLSIQILLIDQVVRTLDVELQKLRRDQQLAMNHVDKESEDVQDEDAANSIQEEKSRSIDKQMDRLHEKGLEWFRFFTELDTKLARMVPPLREVLWRSIKNLGVNFVCVDERETCTLLQLMLEDPSRINLLSECFCPAAAPTRFVEMFSKLMSASGSSKLSSEEKLILLRRFDFRVWLQTKAPHTPTKFDRETVLCIVLGDICNQFPADRSLMTSSSGAKPVDKVATIQDAEHLEEVLKLYANILQLICSMHIEDHIEKVLHALVGIYDDYRFHNNSGNGRTAAEGGGGSTNTAVSSQPRPADATVWEAIVMIPFEVWKRLPFVQIEECASFFSHHMTTLRWQNALSTTGSGSRSIDSSSQYPIVHWQRLGVLKNFMDLFTIFCRVAPEKHQWTLIMTFFEPMLSTLYQPASTTGASSISAPWSEQDTFSTGSTICSCFVAACSEYLKTRASKSDDVMCSDETASTNAMLTQNEKLSQIWTFYLNVLIPHAPVHICKHFHQFLTRLGWEHWCLTLEVVQQMRELIQTEMQSLLMANVPSVEVASSSPYPFVSWLVRDVLCRMTWKSTEKWLEDQSEIIRSVFLLEFAKLCVELVLDYPHFNPPQSHTQRSRAASSSSNVLPPYFVNFIKLQSAFWSKWKMSTTDLETLLMFTLEALKEPLVVGESDGNSSMILHNRSDSIQKIFPAVPTAAVMQDAFSRLQLVLRLLGQITTIHHTALTKKESFARMNLFIKTIFSVFEISDYGRLDSQHLSPDRSAWLMVLCAATCTVFYEKLDEVVQYYRREGTGGSNDHETAAAATEEDLEIMMIGVLRFCNLGLVEKFFKQEQQAFLQGNNKSSAPPSNGSLNWSKCGNVIFVEIDGLIRDFASNQKSLLQDKYGKARSTSCSNHHEEKDEDAALAMPTTSSVWFPSEAFGNPLGRLLWSFLAFRGGELCCLGACGRAIASVHVMSQVSEKSIEKWIIEDRRGAWSDLVTRLKVPELSEEEFENACLEWGNLMTLQVLFMQQLQKAPVLTEAFSMGMLSKLMGWMEKIHVNANVHALIEMKILFFAAEITNFVCKPLSEVLPSQHKKQMLRQLCNILLKFGNARKNHGIMKAIGMGGSLKNNVEFHVCCLTIGVFLRLQTRNSAPLRVDERIPLKVTRTTEKHLKSLEQLLATKDCFQISKRMEWMLEFVKNPKHSLADQDEFFVSLFSRMYPSHPWLLAKCT